MSANKDQYMVRFPQGMRDALKEEAERNERTMNAEIIVALKAHMSSKTEKADVLA